MLEYCVERDVCLTAYSPLAEGTVPGDDRLAEIGAPSEKSASQVALHWLVQRPTVAAIPKASRATTSKRTPISSTSNSRTKMAAVADIGDGLWDRLAVTLGLR